MPRTIPINEFSIPVGGTNDVISAAGFNAFFGKAAKVTAYIGADAVGLTQALSYDDGETTVSVIPQGSGVGTLSTAGKIKTNEDFVSQFAVPPGCKLLWNVGNPTAAAVKVNAAFLIE